MYMIILITKSLTVLKFVLKKLHCFILINKHIDRRRFCSQDNQMG